MDLLQILQNRRSVREYTDEEIGKSKIERILQAGLLSASSRGSKPWEFIVVKNRKTLKQMSECRIGAAKILEKATCAIVVIADAELSDIWAEDCSIAMANMHLMADSIGVGSCWVQGRLRLDASGRSTEGFLRNILDFPREYKLEAILSLGIPTCHPESYDLDELPWDKVHLEKY